MKNNFSFLSVFATNLLFRLLYLKVKNETLIFHVIGAILVKVLTEII